MAGPKIIPENIIKKINTLEAERLSWVQQRDTSSGLQRKLAETALTQIEARLRWYRSRAGGPKYQPSFTKAGRRLTKRRNAARLSAIRPSA